MINLESNISNFIPVSNILAAFKWWQNYYDHVKNYYDPVKAIDISCKIKDGDGENTNKRHHRRHHHHHNRHRHRHHHGHHRPQCPLPIANYRTIGQLGDQEANSAIAIAILHFCRNVYFCSISVLVLWWPKAKLPAAHYPEHSSFGPPEYFFLIGNLIPVTISISFLSLFLEKWTCSFTATHATQLYVKWLKKT